MNNFEDILKDKYPQKWWLGILTSIGALLLLLASQVAVVAILAIVFQVSLEIPSQSPSFEKEMNFAIFIIGIGFIGPLIVLLLYRKYVQKLPLISLISATKFRPRLLLIGALAAIITIGFDFVLMGVLESYFNIAPKISEPIDRITQYGFDKFIILSVTYFIVVIFQAGFEELFFRGFMMQHIRRTGVNMVFATIITSIVFCAGHILEGVPLSALFTIFMMGMAFQIGTNITQGVEAATGAHIANNFILLGIVGVLDNTGGEDPAAYLSGIFYFAAFLGAVFLAKRLWPEDFPVRAG